MISLIETGRGGVVRQKEGWAMDKVLIDGSHGRFQEELGIISPHQCNAKKKKIISP